MVNFETISEKEKKVLEILQNVTDPEVPVLSILDLGMVRKIYFNNDELFITVTSTYSGCPATDMINTNIRLVLIENGFQNINITQQLSPPWTTDWMSDEGKRKLKEYGIAPPNKKFSIPKDGVECPLCNSENTKLISEFGSTSCKALYQCSECKEPFDFFKCH